MKLYELAMALCEKLELIDPDLIKRARASWDPTCSSMDGVLAEQIHDRIKLILPSFDNELKRKAYNEIADADEMSRVDEDENEFDWRISDALLGPVIDMLMEAEGGDEFPAQRSLH